MRPGRVLQITGQGEACFHTDLSAPLASTLSHERATLDYLCTAFAGIAGYSFFQAGRRGLAMRGLGCSPCYWATLKNGVFATTAPGLGCGQVAKATANTAWGFGLGPP